MFSDWGDAYLGIFNRIRERLTPEEVENMVEEYLKNNPRSFNFHESFRFVINPNDNDGNVYMCSNKLCESIKETVDNMVKGLLEEDK